MATKNYNAGFLSIGVGLVSTGLQKDIAKVERRMRKFGRELNNIGQSLTKGVTLPLAGLGVAAAKAAIDFESAFAGVRKTVDATEGQFKELEKGILDLSKRLPASAEQIAKVAENAGQLGIERKNILSFTETMIRLGDSTNVSADQASIALAKLANVTKLPEDQFSNLGSAIIDLGNNSATLESDIINLAENFAATASQAGLTHGEIIGLAAALSSTGVEAEAGGSAMVRVFEDMNSAVISNSGSLENYSKIIQGDFRKAFQESASGAFTQFIAGLSEIQKAGGDVTKALESVGIDSIRTKISIKNLSQDVDGLAAAFARGNQAFSENTALLIESDKRYETLASQLSIAWNNVKILAISFGNVLTPYIKTASEYIIDLAQRFESLSEETKKSIVVFAAVAAAIGPVVLAIGGFIAILGAPIALAATGTVTAIAGISGALVYFWDDIKETITYVKNFGKAIAETFPETLKVIQDFASGAATALKSYYKSLFDYAGNILKDVKDTTSSVVSFFSGPIKDTIKGLGQTFGFETNLGEFSKNLKKIEIAEAQLKIKAEGTNNAIEEQDKVVTKTKTKFEELVDEITKGTKAYEGLTNQTDKATKSKNKLNKSLLPKTPKLISSSTLDKDNPLFGLDPFSQEIAKLGGGLFGDTGFGSDLALQVSNSVASGLSDGFSSDSVKDSLLSFGKSAASAVATSFGGPVGGAIAGSIFDTAISTFSSLAKGEKISKRDKQGIALTTGLATGGLSIVASELYNGFKSVDAETAARKQVENFLEDTLGKNVIFGGFVENFSDAFNEIAGEGVGAFSVLGEAVKDLAGVTEDIGPQIGFILSQNLNGNLDEARRLTQKLGLSAEELTNSFVNLGLEGTKSWHEVEVMLQGVNKLTGEGRVGVGDYVGALKALQDGAGTGVDPLLDLRDAAIEAEEAGISSLEGLKQNLLSLGQFDEDFISRVFTSLAQRNITSLEDLKTASDRTLGGVIADMQSLGQQWNDFGDSIGRSTESLGRFQSTLKDIQDNANIDIKIRYKEVNQPEFANVSTLTSGLNTVSGGSTVVNVDARGAQTGAGQQFRKGANVLADNIISQTLQTVAGA